MRHQPSSLGFAEGSFLGLPAGPSSRITRFGLWISVIWITVFWRIASPSLIDPDEAHYAQITREMRRLGDYLVPRIDGVAVIDKPAFFHWLQAASFALVGENELAARLPTALAALVLIWTTYWIGKRLFGPETGERGALMVAVMPLTFVLARFAYFDMIFNAFLFGALSLLIVSAIDRRRALQIPAFVLLSLAAQTKGPFVFIVVTAAALVACLSKDARVYVRRIDWIPGLAGAGLLALPWFLLMWRRFGDAFIQDYVFYNNLELFAAPLYRRRFDAFFYFRSAAASLFPWSIICVGALIDGWRRRRSGEAFTPKQIILWTWVGVVFAFFSASRFKLDHYIYPLAPAACLLAADAWQRARTDPDRRYFATVTSIAIAGILLIVIGAAGVLAILRANLQVPLSSLAFPVGIGFGAAVWLAVLIGRRFRPPSGLPFTVLVLFVYVTVVFVGVPLFRAARPGADLGRWLKTEVTAADHIIIFDQGRWKASLRYYADHPVQQTRIDTELIDAWRLPKRVYGVMVERDLQVLRDAGLPYRIVHTERAVVATSGRIVRRQVWGDVLVVTNEPGSPTGGQPPAGP